MRSPRYPQDDAQTVVSTIEALQRSRPAVAVGLRRLDGDWGREISISSHERFGVEDDPAVRARMAPAPARRPGPGVPDGCNVAGQVRVSAALAWSCLVEEDPVPNALRAVPEGTATEELDRLVSPIPRFKAVDDAGCPHPAGIPPTTADGPLHCADPVLGLSRRRGP
ncbi:hypothetical protein [Streptomyces sp. SID3343]|uniref:hypothetical protein n=1 Tax=Streptomyces sp. SID3343 TaxID=2690260 RepID=UPI00136BB4B0|nr:hypothetical protein [Streptomyces sp. SID3343]MYW05437.1 hypothetical protein [Streptomyces sp. SID3343]